MISCPQRKTFIRQEHSHEEPKEDDIVELREKSKQMANIDGSLSNKERDVPEYLLVDQKQKTIKFSRVPKFSEVPYPVVMEPNLVIEYYSR